MDEKSKNILIVEDEKSIRNLGKRILEKKGYEVEALPSAEEGLDIMKEKLFGVLLLDISLPGMDGMEMLRILNEQKVETEVVVITGEGTVVNAVDAMKLGAYDFVTKPFEIKEIRDVVKKAYDLFELNMKVKKSGELVNMYRQSVNLGRHRPVKKLLKDILKLAVEAVSADCGTIGFFSNEGEKIDFFSTCPSEEGKIREGSLRVMNDESDCILRDPSPRIVSVSSECGNIFKKLTNPHEVKSSIDVPLLSRDKALGVLILNITRSNRKFKKYELKVINEFAAQAAGVLQDAEDYEKLKELEKLKTDFIANVSHEFRTPLQSMLGSCEIMEERIKDAGNSKILALLKRNTLRMKGLVEQLLEFSRLEARKYKIKPEDVKIEITIQEAIEELKSAADKKNINIINRVRNAGFVKADPEALKRVVLNLIDNAIKYSPESSRVEILSANVDDKVEIRVKDNGKGLEAGEKEKIFDRFYQQKAGSILNGKNSGIGLGLSIIKSIVEMHGGSVGVKSEEGVGSEFYFQMPSVEVK
ncbi:MAG: response regulator [Elusimicrobiota bacterium]